MDENLKKGDVLWLYATLCDNATEHCPPATWRMTIPISLYESLSRDLYRVHVTFGGHYLIINIQYSS
jgi:hypothetical protein